MSKFVFYHLYAKNKYIQIHNNIFSKIVSNPFFDDCTFFFSIVIGDSQKIDMNRLIKPKKYFIEYYKNQGTEKPALLEMQKRSEEYGFTKEDCIGYIHCKGVTNSCCRQDKNYQNTLLSYLCVEQWVNELSFFLIDNIHKYIPYLIKYGSLTAWATRHSMGKMAKSGSLGNFWWATGDVIMQCLKIDNNIVEKNIFQRHYFEAQWLGQMIELSDREYKTSFYVHDGDITLYKNYTVIQLQMVSAFWNSDLIALCNMDIPFQNENLVSVKVVVSNIDHIDRFFNISSKFIDSQRFKNLCVKSEQYISKEIFESFKYKYDNIINKDVNNLISISLSLDEMEKQIENFWFIDILARFYRNSENNYDYINDQYKNISYGNIVISPNDKIIKGVI